MVVLAFCPFLLAYGKAYSLKIPFYLQVAFVLIPLLVIAASVGIIFSLILMHFFPAKKTRDILVSSCCILGGWLVPTVSVLPAREVG
jgi:hypothetical protein